MDRFLKSQILSIKAQYRLHKQIAMKIQKAIEKNDCDILPDHSVELLLNKLGKKPHEWKDALKIAKDWHLQQFLDLIFKYYAPTLTKESGAELDHWIKIQIDANTYTLFDDCQVPFDPNYPMVRFMQFDSSQELESS